MSRCAKRIASRVDRQTTTLHVGSLYHSTRYISQEIHRDVHHCGHRARNLPPIPRRCHGLREVSKGLRVVRLREQSFFSIALSDYFRKLKLRRNSLLGLKLLLQMRMGTSFPHGKRTPILFLWEVGIHLLCSILHLANYNKISHRPKKH